MMPFVKSIRFRPGIAESVIDVVLKGPPGIFQGRFLSPDLGVIVATGELESFTWLERSVCWRLWVALDFGL